MHQELYGERLVDSEHCLRLLPKWERRRWCFITEEDRVQRLTLGSLGGLPRVEVHHRVGLGHYEGMAWEHPMVCLTQSRGKAHRMAIKPQLFFFGRG